MPVLEPFCKKVGDLKAFNIFKKKLQHRCFPVNIAKFLKTAFFIEHLRWLLLREINSKQVSTRVNEKKIKSSRKKYMSCEHALNFDQ